MRPRVALFVASAIVMAASPAGALECRVDTPEERLKHASTAFVGRVIENVASGSDREITFQVSERFKGAQAADTVRVRVHPSKRLARFTPGADFLVFASEGGDHALTVNECSGTIETGFPAELEPATPVMRAAYERELADTLERLRAARPVRRAELATGEGPAPPCQPSATCPTASRDSGEVPKSTVHLGGVHVLGGVGAGTEDGRALRISLEAGALLAFGPPAQTTRDGWSYRPTQGLVAGLAWSQGLERLRGEAYGEVGWATSSGYGGLLLVGGPAVRVVRDFGGGMSARACGWAMAIEVCLRATGTFVEHRDASALLLVGLGVD